MYQKSFTIAAIIVPALFLSACDADTMNALSQGLSQYQGIQGQQVASGNAKQFPSIDVKSQMANSYQAHYYAINCADKVVVYPAANACEDARQQIER